MAIWTLGRLLDVRCWKRILERRVWSAGLGDEEGEMDGTRKDDREQPTWYDVLTDMTSTQVIVAEQAMARSHVDKIDILLSLIHACSMV